MVRNQQHCSILDSNISLLSILHCQHQQHPNLLLFSFYMAFLKALSLVLFFSFFTQLHLATSFLGHQSITSSMLMTLSSSFLSLHATSNKTFNSYKTPFLKSRPGWLPTSFLSTPLKLNFYSLVFLPSSLKLIILLYLCLQALPSNLLLLLKILGLIFDSNLSVSDHISYISKTCFAHLRDLRRIRNTLDHTTACTIATSLIHSNLDYCNSLFLNLNCQQTNRLQLILNSTARAVSKTPKYNHITPHLKSLHWLKITQRIQYKILSLSLTYKSLQFKQPSSILDLLKIQPTHSTRSSAVVTLQRPSNPSRLKITDRSFYHQAPALWNSLPQHLRALSSTSPTQTNNSLLSLSSSQFHKQLQTYLFLQPYPL